MMLYQKSRGLACGLVLASSVALATVNHVPIPNATVQAAIDLCGASGDSVAIDTAGSYAGTTFIPGKTDISINIGFKAGVQDTKSIGIAATVPGVILKGTVKVEKSSTVTLTGLTVQADGAGGTGNKGIVCNDTDTPYPSDFSGVTLVGTTVSATLDDGIRLNGSNMLTLTNSAVLNSTGRNVTTDGNANFCTINLTNSQVNGALGGNGGLRLHRQTNVTATNSQIKNNTGFGIFVDSFTETGVGDNFNFTNCDISGNTSRNIFLARTAVGSFTGCTIVGAAGSNELLFQFGGLPYNLTFTNCTINQSLGNGIAMTAIDNSGTQSTFTLNQCTVIGGSNGVIHTDNESDIGTRWNTLIANRTTFRSRGAGLIKDTFSGANVDLEDTKATLINCVIDGGTSGVLVRNGNQLKAYHCTVTSQSGQTTGGVEIRDQRAATANSEVRNSIVDGPTIGVRVGTGLTPAVDHNLVNGTVAAFSGIASTGNATGLSPAFVTNNTGPGTGNFHLQNSSAAIAIGVAGLSSTDFDGGVRPLPALSAPDAGAFENATGTSAVADWNIFM